MAFEDWEFFANDSGNATISLTSSDAITDTSSLQLSQTGGTNRGINGQLKEDSVIVRGISRGKIRTLIKLLSGSTNEGGGLFCLASDEDVTNANSAYCLIVERTAGGVGNILLTRGDLADLTTLETYEFDATYSFGTVIAIELEWNDDTPANEIGGTYLIARYGTMTDFSDLSDVINYVDASTGRLTFGAGYEGVCLRDDGTSNPSVVFDQTEIFTIS